MDLLAERGRRISVDELNTTRLAHARKQAVQRKLDDILIVDVDAHHYENEHYSEILPYMENDVFKQWTMGGRGQTDRGSIVPTNAGFIQDMGGRVTRYPLRRSEKTEPGGKFRDVQLGERWMDAMSVDYSCLFPTGMLNIGMHPQKEMEVDLCWAYNRWVTEKVLPESGGRMYSMLCLPFSDPEACVRQVETFGGRPGVTGFMVTTCGTCRSTTTPICGSTARCRSAGLRSRSIPGRTGTSRCSAPATASCRCTRSASPSTTSCI